MRNLRIYLLPLGAWWLFLVLMLIVYGYEGSFLVMNSWHTPWLDQPMYYLGMLGDALLLGSLMVLLHRRKPDDALSFILVLVLTGIVAQFMKQIIFPGWDRPLKVIGDDSMVHIVNQVRLMHNSFPSGHSVSAGAVFTLLAWFHRDNRFVLVFSLLFAILVPYTRIYTGAHFPGDILAGSMIGSLFTLGMIPVFNSIESGIEKKSEYFVSGLRKWLVVLAVVGLLIFIATEIW